MREAMYLMTRTVTATAMLPLAMSTTWRSPFVVWPGGDVLVPAVVIKLVPLYRTPPVCQKPVAVSSLILPSLVPRLKASGRRSSSNSCPMS